MEAKEQTKKTKLEAGCYIYETSSETFRADRCQGGFKFYILQNGEWNLIKKVTSLKIIETVLEK